MAATIRWLKQSIPGKILCTVAGTMLVLLLMYAVAYRHADRWHLWLPTSQYNDEVMYNRQLAGILSGGQPRGYFGYQETHAQVGHFGAWGPVLIYLYAIPGLLVGNGVNTMFWCNVGFAVVGWGVFSVGANLSWKRQLSFAVSVFFLWLPMEQVFSGLAEPALYFLILVILGGTVALNRKWNQVWFWCVAVACVLATVVRAYTVALWIFPIVLLWKQKKRRWVIGSIILAALSLAGYFAVTVWYNSPFFAEGDVDFTAFERLFRGDVAGAVGYQVWRIGEQLVLLGKEYVAPTLQGTVKPQGLAFLLLLLLEIFALAATLLDLRHKREACVRSCALVCVFLSQVAMLALYEMEPMTRHYTMLSVILLAACICDCRRIPLLCLPVVALAFGVVFWQGLRCDPLPTYAPQIDEQILQIKTKLMDSQKKYEECADPWDHTIAYSYGDTLFHGYLYAVPEGMGIQFDWNTYLADSSNPIRSRYVMVGHDGEAEARLLADNWQEVVSTQDLVVYERQDAAS